METTSQTPSSAALVVTESTSESILDRILTETKLRKNEEAYEVAKEGLCALLRGVGEWMVERFDTALVDTRVAAIDRVLSLLADSISHHPEFQRRQAAWVGARDLVRRTDLRQNIRIKLLNVSKADLLADFEDATSDVTRSGFYKLVYSDEYGTLGGKPYGAILANYEIGPGAQDLFLLEKASAVAAMAHAPFIAAASPEFFGLEDSLGLPRMKDIASHFEGTQFARWRALRDNPDTQYAALLVRRHLLRLPYGPDTVPAKSFNYRETVAEHEHYLWGNDVFLFGSRLTESFAKHRWCAHIVGPQAGGAVDGLPLHVYEDRGLKRIKVPTEVPLTERLEFELAEAGFIAPTYEKDTDRAVFFSANSVHRPKSFPKTEKGQIAEANYKLGTQLPYQFIVTRIAHALKMRGRDLVGMSLGPAEIQRDLNEWLGQYVCDSVAPPASILGLRPMRAAQVIVSETPGNPGWYRYELILSPHPKIVGSDVSIALVGKLESQAA